MKVRLLAGAVAGLACAFPVGAGAQAPGADQGRPYGAAPFASGPPTAGGPRYALPPDRITASVRAAGMEPLSRPLLRGAVYYVRAVNRARTEMRVAIDARSGRILSASRVANEPAAPAVAGEPGPAPAPRYEPYLSTHGYSEAAPSPPADVPVEGRPVPPARGPNYATTSPAKRVASQPPMPRARRGESGEVTGSVPETPAAPAAKPEPAPSAPNPVAAKPAMVPIAPLE